MSLYYDLHTHTHHSDGLLCPRDLVREAHASGIGGIALTDHDVTSGLQEAEETAQELGLELIPGVEVSVTWGGQTIHIVGIRIDSGHPGLQAGLARLQAVRHERAEAMGERLSRCGIEGVYQGVLQQSHGMIVGRTHFARYLVAHGFAKDIRQAFKRYLRKGGSGYVATKWASLGEAVGWIRAAAGVAVIAHPARYGLTSGALRRLIEEFKEAGGAGIEVVSGSHNSEEVERFAELSLIHGLLASAGSDYHGPGETRAAVGRLQPLPDRCTPLWSLWASS